MKTFLETPKQTTKTGIPPAKRSIWCSVLFAVLLLTLALGLTPSSFGQGITGSIAGTVTDSSGAAFPERPSRCVKWRPTPPVSSRPQISEATQSHNLRQGPTA